MKKFYKPLLFIIVLFFLLITINKITFREFEINTTNDAELIKYEIDNKKYNKSLPASSTLEISDNFEKIIQKSVYKLDSNFFLKGRDYNKMLNPKMLKEVVNEARKGGGSSSGNTFFNNLLNKEIVTFTIYTETNPEELKLINRFTKYDEKFKINEIWFKYLAKIKIEYNIKVGNNEKTSFYYENTEICSPIKLI